MWAHAMRFQWSISFACKKFHLALEMLLSKPLWQPVTTLPTYFIASHTRPFRDQGCELIGGFPALAPEEEKQSSASSSLPGVEAGDIFRESLIASGKSRPRNPWAAVGSLAFQLLLLLALVVIPLFHTDPLPKREMLTMLYAPPLAAVASNATRLQAPTSAYTSASIGSPAPNSWDPRGATGSCVDTTGGVVGGVPGGVAGEFQWSV